MQVLNCPTVPQNMFKYMPINNIFFNLTFLEHFCFSLSRQPPYYTFVKPKTPKLG